MLTSIISLYIASTLNPETEIQPINKEIEIPAIVTTANTNLSNIFSKTAAPIKDPAFISPIIKARASISMDLKSGEILYEKNAHNRLSIASITKIMTVLIVIEENGLHELVKVSDKANKTEGSTMHLRTGETITVEDLIYGALINSANDATVALAEHNAGSVTEFVKKMNKKALELGLLNTNFSNPTGLDHPHNYSSAYDIAKLSQHVYQNQFIRHAARNATMEVKSIDGKFIHQLESTNKLLDNDVVKVKGLKTGKTENAGQCLVAIGENEEQNEIITVVLNSPDRFQETKILIDWIFRAYSW